MGYELHIIRRNDWDNDEEESDITLDEWLKYVATDSELKLTNGYEIKIPNVQSIWHNSPGFCLWTAHPESKSSNSLWFDFGSGIISAKYPDDYTIMKMIQIAAVLDAKVQGDDGEYYDNSYFDKKEAQINKELNELTQQKNLTDKKRWWKLW